jgi:MoxR-like ATPase
VAEPVLRHRILLNYAAEAEGVRTESVIDALVSTIRPPESGIPG